MRVLFAMAYPGYLRYYDSTIRELAERGHEVDIYFDTLEKQVEGLEALAAIGANVRLRGALLARDKLWRTVGTEVRRVTDFVRYLDPPFAQAAYLRRRAATRVPAQWRFITRLDTLPPRPARLLLRSMLWIEQAIPPSREFEEMLAAAAPDVVVATPVVVGATRQNDLLRSAGGLGIPTAAAIASWDHLTTKGMLRVPTTRVLVWNEIQAREAHDLHHIPRERIVVTGAQPFDKWFDRGPRDDRAAFCARVGLPDRPFVLFLGSTASIAAHDAEQRFVRRWIVALRSSRVDRVAGLGVLVRPHPFNSEGWRNVDLSDLPNVAVWPREGANPVDESDRDDYFDSLFHASAAVGINTSAMIEAAIVGTPVLTVTSPEFAETQLGTLHFRYLVPDGGGFAQAATSLEEHVAQLAAVIEYPEAAQERLASFVRSFVRPHGVERESTTAVVDAIEQLPACSPVRVQPGPTTRLVGGALLRLWARSSSDGRRVLRRARRRRSAELSATGPRR
jgi:hypothetical protein